MLGTALVATGVPLVFLGSNLLTGLLGLLAVSSYVAVYTPLKRVSGAALFVGAVPGALPPLMGWTAVTGQLDLPGLALFAILFLWQIPHFLAIAIYRADDYARAGFKVLPLTVSNGATRVTIVVFSVVLVATTILLEPLHVAGMRYAFVRGAAWRRVHRLGGGWLPAARVAAALVALAVLLFDRLPDAAVHGAGVRPDRRMSGRPPTPRRARLRPPAAHRGTHPPLRRAHGAGRRSASTSRPASCSACSAPTAPARPPRSACSRGCCPRRGDAGARRTRGQRRRHALPRPAGRRLPGPQPGSQADRAREPAAGRRALRSAARAGEDAHRSGPGAHGARRARRRGGGEVLRAACGAASRSRACCCTSPSCCCSTSRAAASIPKPCAASGTRSSRWPRARGISVIVTTHQPEEAERCHRIAILDGGRLVALGTPDELRALVAGDVVRVRGDRPDDIRAVGHGRLGIAGRVVDGDVVFETPARPRDRAAHRRAVPARAPRQHRHQPPDPGRRVREADRKGLEEATS